MTHSCSVDSSTLRFQLTLASQKDGTDCLTVPNSAGPYSERLTLLLFKGHFTQMRKETNLFSYLPQVAYRNAVSCEISVSDISASPTQ